MTIPRPADGDTPGGEVGSDVVSGETHTAADTPHGLGRAVAAMALVVVVVAVAVPGCTRLFGDEAGADLTVEEMEAVLLSEAEVDRRAVTTEPFASTPYDDLLAGPGAGFAEAEASLDISQCNQLVQRILPGQRDPAAAAAFRRSDGSTILHTVDLAREDDMSISELSDRTELCGFPMAQSGSGGLSGWFVPRQGSQLDDLGDSAFWVSIDLQGPPDVPPHVQANYLTVVVVERAGILTTVTVIAGADLRDNRELALGLARAADRKLTDSI
jgi:hypothetical protein